MPDITELFHQISLRDEGMFIPETLKAIALPDEDGIQVGIGKLRSDPDGSKTIQAYLFDKRKYSYDDAQAWVSVNRKPSAQGMQRRIVDYTSRLNFDDQKNPKIEGYAAVFNKRTRLFGDFWEQIAPGAFSEAIQSDDIYALFNHDPSKVLGNTGAKNLFLEEDANGLRYTISPIPDTPTAREVMTLVKTEIIRKSSFGFNIEEYKDRKLTEEKGILRTILRVKPLFDVSPVTYPAYPQTEVHARMIELENECLCFDGDRVIELPAAKAAGADITGDELTRRFEELKKKVL